ncbi:uncharacterized protein LOC135357232 [Latimeria chalumnae]|uniref:uncharacterized protein LOC135357232 n=1 Tax=Latimeria chalumnae TaxID=7897 RepID=UPI00313D91D0
MMERWREFPTRGPGRKRRETFSRSGTTPGRTAKFYLRRCSGCDMAAASGAHFTSHQGSEWYCAHCKEDGPQSSPVRLAASASSGSVLDQLNLMNRQRQQLVWDQTQQIAATLGRHRREQQEAMERHQLAETQLLQEMHQLLAGSSPGAAACKEQHASS